MEKRNHWNIYPPKPITKDAFLGLVGYLRKFKQGLNPTQRILTARIFGERICAEKRNDEIDSILDPVVIEDIYRLTIFVLLRKDEEKSVETMIEISPQHTHINTSDIGTDWGYAIQAAINNYLLENKIVSKAFFLRLNKFLVLLQFSWRRGFQGSRVQGFKGLILNTLSSFSSVASGPAFFWKNCCDWIWLSTDLIRPWPL